MEYMENIHPVILAVGWPEGLKILIETGFWSLEALNMAMALDDIESVQLLLGGTRAFPKHWSPSRIDEMCLRSKEMLVNEFRSRWLRLTHFYRRNLHGHDLETSDSQYSTSPNYDPDEMYRELEISGVHTPEGLKSCGWGYEVAFDVDQLNLYFSAGLRNLDGRLQRHPPMAIAAMKSADLEMIRWFLDHGANPNFPFHPQNTYPNLLFYLYPSLTIPDITSREDYEIPKKQGFNYDLAKYLNNCDPLQSDDCHCFCSATGCLPLKSFWAHCDLSFDMPCNSCQIKKTENWISFVEFFSANFIQLTTIQMEIYYREACRMVLFDRLNMTHTCCRYEDAVNYWYLRTPRLDAEERDTIQEEEAELSKQLEALLQAYDNARNVEENSFVCFWRIWWGKIDEILPPIPPKERCGHARVLLDEGEVLEMCERRRRRESECLKIRGYDGWDFYDVIHHHLSKFLEQSEVFHECL